MDVCHCGSGQPIEDCCLPVIRGERQSKTAVELMRSRYTAFVIGDVDWILASHHPDTRDEVDREEIERWSSGSEWLGLRIKETIDGEAGDSEGIVHFRARYKVGMQQVEHVERARFERYEGEWLFHSVIEDEQPALVPVVPASSVGRNDQCLCGSGKKHKRCCGLV